MAKDYTARAPGTVAVRLDVTPEVRSQLRQMAAAKGLHMSQFVRELVEKAVAKNLKKSAK